ncbi:MAG: tRNA lysidine(34) synthetase TilS [Spirochaetota bacterium]|nr:tRNA lysidine(34) synthetase TilS [Spirochaetota bacterium]
MDSNSIYHSVRDFIDRNNLLNKGDRILLSLSAGKDSMALLDCMLYLRDDLYLEIAIFHLNHLMRGEESDEDERFLLRIAEEKALEIFIERCNFSSEILGGASFEGIAREKRYEIADLICSKRGFQKIATAHNRNDNIETIVMRIFKGTGIHGLAGISVKRGNIIRPILFLTPEEIYRHLRDEGLAWREDSSNIDNTYCRNQIRNTLLPQISDRFRGAPRAINHLSEISKEYTSLIDDLIYEKYGILYEERGNCIYIDMDRYIDDKRLLKYVISTAIRDYLNEYVHWGMMEEIYRRACVKRSNMVLYENRSILVKKTFRNHRNEILISINSDFDSAVDPWEYRIDLYDNMKERLYIKEIDVAILVKYVNYDYFLKNFNRNNKMFITLNDINDYVIIRNRRRGDRIRLEQGTKKIKDLMIENKLDSYSKAILPLLVVNSRIAAYMSGIVDNVPNRVSVDFWIRHNSKKILAIQKIGNYK